MNWHGASSRQTTMSLQRQSSAGRGGGRLVFVPLSSRVDFLEDPLDVDRVLLGLAEAHLPRSRDVDMVGCHTANASKEGRRGCQFRRQATTQARVGQAGGHEHPTVGIPIFLDDVRQHRLRCHQAGGGISTAKGPPAQTAAEQARRGRAKFKRAHRRIPIPPRAHRHIPIPPIDYLLRPSTV